MSGQFTYPMFTVWTCDEHGNLVVDNDFQTLTEAFKFFDTTTGKAIINRHNDYSETQPVTLIERDGYV